MKFFSIFTFLVLIILPVLCFGLDITANVDDQQNDGIEIAYELVDLDSKVSHAVYEVPGFLFEGKNRGFYKQVLGLSVLKAKVCSIYFKEAYLQSADNEYNLFYEIEVIKDRTCNLVYDDCYRVASYEWKEEEILITEQTVFLYASNYDFENRDERYYGDANRLI